MTNKIWGLFINILYPQSHLITYIESLSHLEFVSLLSPRPQLKTRMFHPFYYKEEFVKDCIIELKERNSKDIARLFGKVLSQWIVREIQIIPDSRLRRNDDSSDLHRNDDTQFYLIPIPQHKSRTLEKGFCHTTTLAQHIYMYIQKYNVQHIYIKPCIAKNIQTKKVHNAKSKSARFKTLQNTMSAHITKQDAERGYFFLIDDVYTTGSTFKEARRSLKDCGALEERMYFVSIAH